MLSALRAISSLLLPGPSINLVCSILIVVAVVQTGSYSVLMPASVMSLLERASSPFRSASLSEPKRRPPISGLPEIAQY